MTSILNLFLLELSLVRHVVSTWNWINWVLSTAHTWEEWSVVLFEGHLNCIYGIQFPLQEKELVIIYIIHGGCCQNIILSYFCILFSFPLFFQTNSTTVIGRYFGDWLPSARTSFATIELLYVHSKEVNLWLSLPNSFKAFHLYRCLFLKWNTKY